MSEASLNPSTRLGAVAVVLSSLVIAVPLLASKVTEAILDSANPAGVDVTQGLAYLRETLGFGFGALGVLLVAIIAVYVVLFRRTGSFAAVRLPLLILVVQLLVGVALLATNGIVNSVDDAYAALV